jgi:hypothetical protein
VTVDYRLLPHFNASRARLDEVRRSLPAAWREDGRPGAQDANERWVEVRAKARKHLELVEGAHPSSALPDDDH